MRSRQDLMIDSIVYSVIITFSIIMLFPFIYVLGNSLMTLREYMETTGLKIIPLRGISLSAYGKIFSDRFIYTSYLNTLFITSVGTVISLFITTVTAYALSRQKLKGRKILMFLYLVTMLFHGGLIPLYMVVKSLGLINSLWSMILPVTVSTYFLIIMKNFFQSIPLSFEEAAYIDGASDISILFKIFIPLSGPAIATIALFYAVNYWNSFFLGVIFLTDKLKWPLQLLLRDIIVESNEIQPISDVSTMSHSVKMATIIVAIVPILCIYPFLQKYFAKGVLVGAIKG